MGSPYQYRHLLYTTDHSNMTPLHYHISERNLEVARKIVPLVTADCIIKTPFKDKVTS